MVTFIIRDYPDLDHIFPIIKTFLNKKEKIYILNFEINLNLRNDPRIIYLNNDFSDKLTIYDVYSIKGKRFFLDTFINFLSSSKFKEVNFKNISTIKKKNNFFKLFFLVLICYLKRVFFSSNNIFEKKLFNDIWANNIVNKLKISSLVLDDSYYFNHSRPQSIINVCKLKNIKITLVPHTCYMFTRSEEYKDLKSRKLKNFYPNIVVTSNKMRLFYNKCGVDLDKIKNLGSARFCRENINTLRHIFRDFERDLNKDILKKKLKVLYIDGVYDNDVQKKELINNISRLNFVNFIIKAHPRGNFLSQNSSNIQKNGYSVDIFTPTKVLIQDSDIIICTYSSILIEAMLLYKKIILPKFFLNKESNFDIFYEEFGFANIFNHPNEIISFLKLIDENKNKEEVNKEKIDNFIRDFVYGGNFDSSNIMENYYNLIK